MAKTAAHSPARKHIRIVWLLIWGPFLFLFLLVSMIALQVFGDLPSVEELQNPKSNLATVIYSGDLKILGKYYAENRVNIRFLELDADVAHALVATEDARFYEHSGVDLKALFRSASGVATGNSNRGGGSTITQQLAKMLFPREKLSKPEMVIRKIKEWVIAARLEKSYTKEEIMAMYLNKFDFLHLAVGIKSASQIYFNTTPDSLRIEQAAMLVGMAKNPSLFDPIRRPDTTLHRRNVVMKQMVKYGYLSEAQYDSLKKLPLALIYRPEDHNDGPAPYFREFLRDELKQWCEKHENPETGKPYNLYKDGLRIYTTIDSRMQQHAEEAVNEHMHDLQIAFFKECKTKKNAPFAWNVNKQDIENIMMTAMRRSDRYKNLKSQGLSKDEILSDFKKPVAMTVYSLRGEIDTVMTPWDSIRYYKAFLQTGFMAVEPQTGYVKAWVGGINHKHFQYDHVQKGHGRQVGSTFKPFVYALAIQEGFSPCYQVPNVRTCITTETGEEWCPDNSDGNKGTGKMVTLRYALAGSINYVTAWIMKQFGPQAVVNLVHRMGVTSEIPAVPSICLGTPDISVFEMVGANATFVNKGTYIQPTYITRIEDKNGKVLEEFVPQSDEVLSEEKAYVMVQLMRGVVDYGTGVRLRYKYGLNNQIAGKTGTTQNNADGWFMGLTPDLVAGVWVGGEDRSVHFNSTAEGQGASMALPIWGKFFQKVYADKHLKVSKGDFEKPSHPLNIELDCSAYDKASELAIPLDDTDDDPFN